MAVWSEVLLSKAVADNRFDAEFYQPDSVEAEQILVRCNGLPLSKLTSDIRYGLHLPPDYSDEGTTFVRALNLKEGGIAGELLKVPFSPEELGRHNILQTGDVLIARSGNVGDIGYVSDDLAGSTFGSYVIRCRIAGILPEYAYIFLLSRLGRLQAVRFRSGAVQPNISIPNLKAILIPRLLDGQQQKVKAKFDAALEARRQAHEVYTEAEALLESALGLDKLDLTPRLFYERPYADVQTASRFDAEYFQPPKKEVLAALARMSGQPVRDQFCSIRQIWQPDQARVDEQVRNFDLTDALQPFLDETVEPTTRDTISSAKKKLEPGDLVVSRLRSYLREIAVVFNAGPVPMVGSTEFIVLRPKQDAVRVEALLVYLRSKYVQTVLKWCQDGSNHPRFQESELLNLRIPDAVREHQDEIAAKVETSIDARRESLRLLEEAKTMVEKAILTDDPA